MLSDYFILGVMTFLIKGAQCEEVFAEAGSQAVLPCKCSRLPPPFAPAIIWSRADKGTVWRKQKSGLQYWGSGWSKNGTQRAHCPHLKFERGDYSLEINNVREEDGGVYSCRVEHGATVTENVVTLRIIRVAVSPSVPIWGSDVSISCSVTPWPPSATVRWMLNDRLFASQTTTLSNGIVRQKATSKLTGNWTCVYSDHGKEKRASVALTVKGIIEPPKDDVRVYAAVGSAVTLPCVFSPGLIPSNPLWEKLKAGSLFKPALDQLPASFSQSSRPPSSDKSAILKEVELGDEGRYRCSGTVEGQTLTRNMKLVVAKVESSVPSQKKGPESLSCELTDTSEVTGCEWVQVVYDLNGTQSIGSVHKGNTLSLDKATEENWGEWTCRFYGKEGILGNVTYHVQPMGALSGKKSSGVSQNTAAVVGLSFLLLVLLLILAQMYKNHRRRQRILQYPALETIVHTTSNEREERERNRQKK